MKKDPPKLKLEDGGEFLEACIWNFLRRNQHEHEFSALRTPEQKGTA